MPLLGFGTGCFYKNLEPVSKKAIALVRNTGCNAIELCAGRRERLDYLKTIPEEDLSSFSYVSLHAPDDVVYADDEQTRTVLDSIVTSHERLNFELVVFHPSKVQDKSVFKEYALPIAFENVDKGFGQTPEEMGEFFSELDARMVLDVLHAHLVDPSNRIAGQFCSRFKDRICQVHLSGHQQHGKDQQQHYPLSETKQLELLVAVPPNLPVIIESVFPEYSGNDLDAWIKRQLKEEYDYVKNNLAGSA